MKPSRLADHRFREDHGPRLGLHRLRVEDGQDLIEYALLAAVLSVAFLASIQTVADGVIPFFDMVLVAFRKL